jgi:hypothetical protein
MVSTLSTLDKVINYKGTIIQGSTKPPFNSQNRMYVDQMKKIIPFSIMLLLA